MSNCAISQRQNFVQYTKKNGHLHRASLPPRLVNLNTVQLEKIKSMPSRLMTRFM